MTSFAVAVRGRGCSSWSPMFKLNFRSFCNIDPSIKQMLLEILLS